LGVFNRIVAMLSAKDGKPDQLMIYAFPKAKALLADPGYDADWFRHLHRCSPHLLVTAMGLEPGPSSRRSRTLKSSLGYSDS
jgi:hypothetical protein